MDTTVYDDDHWYICDLEPIVARYGMDDGEFMPFHSYIVIPQEVTSS